MIKLFSHYVSSKVLALMAVEAVLLALAVYLGASVRFSGGSDVLNAVLPQNIAGLALTFSAVMLLCMTAVGLYVSDGPDNTQAMVGRVLMAFLVGPMVMSGVFYALPDLYLGRGAFGLAWLFGFAAILITRLAFMRWGRLGLFDRRILVLGTGTRAVNVDVLADRNGAVGQLNVVGFLPLMATQHHVQPSRILPAETSLMEAVRKYAINEIVVAVRDRRGGGIPISDLLECKLAGVTVTELSSFYERERGQLRIDSMNASWLVFGEGFRQNPMRELVKRIFDLVVSGVLLVITAPVMAITALLILLEDGAPVLYRQERVGQGGRTFQILKFRSMFRNAESDGKPRWAIRGDDRTTYVGRVIRKVRIDELPQIVNVLRGEMSFVGPRPERPYFVQDLIKQIPYYNARHSVKPGITGWAQVRYPYGASLEDAIEKLQFDLYYVKNHTLFLDIMILLQTIQVVLWGKGAR